MKRTRITGTLCLLAALGGCTLLPGREKPSIVLITLDTVRADRLGCYGHPRRISPRIDRLAREGVLFADAFVPIPETAPSIRSILTSLLPIHHEVRRNGYRPDGAQPTIQSILRREGYRTAAFTSNCVLDRSSGFDAGFDLYDDRLPDRFLLRERGQRTAEKTADAVLAWLSTREKEPFFLWVHFIDPHSLYRPPPPYDNLFGEHPGGKTAPGDARWFLDVIKGRRPLEPEDARRLIDRYDGEIAFLDRQVGRLLDGLDRLAPVNTLVALTADHGESLGEHGYLFDHGDFLYEDQVRVPLLFRHPDLPRGVVAGGPAMSTDILPTVLAFAGVDRPERSDGVNLLPALGGGARTGHPPILLESDGCDGGTMRPCRAAGVRGKLFGLRAGGWKYVTDFGEWEELYDLENDPGETADRAAEERSRAARMRQALREGIGPDPWGAEESLAPATREKLRALGYVD